MKNFNVACLTKLASVLTAVAVVVSAAPCWAQFYQPEVPHSLQK